MSTADARDLAIAVALVLAPGTLVALVALLKGYTLTLHMTRPEKRPDHGE